MCMDDHSKGHKCNSDDGQDNDGGQCEAGRDEFTHVSIPFFLGLHSLGRKYLKIDTVSRFCRLNGLIPTCVSKM
jgi:hypothetical protein